MQFVNNFSQPFLARLTRSILNCGVASPQNFAPAKYQESEAFHIMDQLFRLGLFGAMNTLMQLHQSELWDFPTALKQENPDIPEKFLKEDYLRLEQRLYLGSEGKNIVKTVNTDPPGVEYKIVISPGGRVEKYYELSKSLDGIFTMKTIRVADDAEISALKNIDPETKPRTAAFIAAIIDYAETHVQETQAETGLL